MISTVLIIVILIFVFIIFLLQLVKKPQNEEELRNKIAELQNNLSRLELNLKEEFKTNRDENSAVAKENRRELNETLKDFRTEQTQTLQLITQQTHNALKEINETLAQKIEGLMLKIDNNNQANRDALSINLKDFTTEQRSKFDELTKEQQELTSKTVEQLEKITNKVEEKILILQNQVQATLDKNINALNTLQKERFEQMELKQTELVRNTETKLESIRITVEEKLEKTLSDRLGQSFETVGKQLLEVQRGLGEMQTLAQDVGGLKRVLSNVKMRGGIGEVQLAMLLEQILAPDQYEANVKTKINSNDLVEFAIKLPGASDDNARVWLPIDAKFPKDVYEQLQTAYDTGDLLLIEAAQKNLEITIKKMAKDISDKYLDPPNTTDFGIMFLPFEGIYAEVVRKASLLEELQRTYKIVVTGPTTLAAILNSLQMGFRTLAIQKRSSEVWQILGAVKKEFENFGGLMQKAQNNIQTGLNQLDDVIGKRTKAIQRKLRSVESLNETDAKLILPESSDFDD